MTGIWFVSGLPPPDVLFKTQPGAGEKMENERETVSAQAICMKDSHL